MTGGGKIASSSNLENYADRLNLPTNLDRGYQAAALAYNTQRTNSLFLGKRGDMMAVQVAAQRGFDGGLYYGGAAGFVSAIYYRKVSQIPKIALGCALTYSLLLGSSAWFRMEV